MKKIVTVVSMTVLCLLMLAGCGDDKVEINGDELKYNGQTYVLLEYNQDIFYYSYMGEYKEDKLKKVNGSRGTMICMDGDLYCMKEDAEKISAYYADDRNYSWHVVIDKDGDVSDIYQIDIVQNELDYIYSMENMEKNKAIYFDEIEKQGSLIKTSEDGVIQAMIGLAFYDGSWYWRTEIIDESREKNGTWPEYIQKLPDSLSDRIK